MDFSKFSSEQFSTKDWISEAFRTSGSAPKEQFASTLLMKLQLFIQEVNKDLDETSDQTVQLMPKLIRDLQTVEEEARLLQSKMKDIQKDVEKMEHDTDSTTKTLLELDLAKGRLEQVQRSLKELDNWSSLTKGIEEVFKSGDPDLICSRLVAMQESLRVIGEKVPDLHERQDYLDRLKDQFATIISPSTITAITSQTAESVDYFVRIYASIDRASELEDCFKKCLQTEVSSAWSKVRENEDGGDFPEVMETFYDSINSLWHKHIRWLANPFPSAAKLLLNSLRTGLSELNPPIEKWIEEGLDSTQLLSLIRLKKVTDDFARTIHLNCESAKHRPSDEAQGSFYAVVYSALVHFVNSYKQYEQGYLLGGLNKWDFETGQWDEDVNSMKRSTDWLRHEINEAISRCDNLSNAVALPMLLKTFRTFFDNYLTKITRSLSKFRSGCDFSKENWDRLHHSLAYVQVSGTLLNVVQDVEVEVHGIALKLKHALTTVKENKNPTDAALYFNVAMLEQPEIRKQATTLASSVRDDFAPLLRDVRGQVCVMNDSVHELITDLLLKPITHLLDGIPNMEIWRSETSKPLPSFGLAPQEYITHVGQYLMTFTNCLEPFLSADDDPSFATGLRFHHLPFTDSLEISTSSQAVEQWIRCAGGGVMHHFVEALLSLPKLRPAAKQQLECDLSYICNVLEDLGIELSANLVAIRTLLECKSSEEFRELSKNHPKDVVDALARIAF